jgi:hypothetical protein
MSPHWSASLHHLVAGLLLAGAITLVLRRWTPAWVAVALGISVASMAEGVIEVLEWRFLYRHATSVSAYFDTVADLAMTILGAVVGGILAGIVMAVARPLRPS